MIDKVEVGKKYRLINKKGFLSRPYNKRHNKRLLKHGYFDSDLCVVVDKVNEDGWGSRSGKYIISSEEFPFFELVEENTENEEPKVITQETEVTITTTYGELAKVYYVMGKVNGKEYDKMLWTSAANLLGDSDHLIYWENEPNHPMFNYNAVQEEWESLFFKSKKQIAIEQKRKMIAELEKEIKELES